MPVPVVTSPVDWSPDRFHHAAAVKDELDGDYRFSGALLIAGGTVLTYWAWIAARDGIYEMLQSILGPHLLSLGAGLLKIGRAHV